MADEDNAVSVAEVAVTDTPVKVKRTRGPNKPKTTSEPAKPVSAKAAPEAAPAKAAAVKRGKRGETAAVVKTTSKDAIKAAAPKQVTKKAPAKAAAAKPAVSTGDEFADLIQLEEENKTLRKALAEKLRLENADLRNRLGRA
ncbi:hypothetical protein PDO_5220 [Rhizobium sp. PDO1-076]|uniref:hypothetical protein n=1 Tax=Rhizobium sp. PDO1-076 TaxID=1125979 RepID=UPI00024E23D7|nr:hypothetical protein [Rhizobium sp. PDO1-076]EHS51222.1 hypothetical protein PDO_5220 [Rhizobium sp. PDO1-076]